MFEMFINKKLYMENNDNVPGKKMKGKCATGTA
jgi:hypothetical protein